ncbi:hypothetical protein bcgnr5378_29180 [Bacillus cereus]|nr:hypothetical protein [Bacillus cereus]HDR8331162.1 hypothetical protein [Bacillus cereus]HDR8332896.1 hypothetical protein [Bacillus cereus]
MDIVEHKKYAKDLFPPRLVQMNAELVEKKENLKLVLIYIITELQEHERAGNSGMGVTIKSIADGIVIDRNKRILQGDGTYRYQPVKDNLTRKTAEHLVEQLGLMTLIYTMTIGTGKVIFLTPRGVQVLKYFNEQKTQQTQTQS